MVQCVNRGDQSHLTAEGARPDTAGEGGNGEVPFCRFRHLGTRKRESPRALGTVPASSRQLLRVLPPVTQGGRKGGTGQTRHLSCPPRPLTHRPELCRLHRDQRCTHVAAAMPVPEAAAIPVPTSWFLPYPGVTIHKYVQTPGVASALAIMAPVTSQVRRAGFVSFPTIY